MSAQLPAVSVPISTLEAIARILSNANTVVNGCRELAPPKSSSSSDSEPHHSASASSESDATVEHGRSSCENSVTSSDRPIVGGIDGEDQQQLATVVSLPDEKEEGKWQFLAQARVFPKKRPHTLQTCLPFLLAGMGMVGAGMLLNGWRDGLFLASVPEAFVLIPALLGLKGNLEMTLASRLATMAHLGQLDGRAQKVRAFYSNMAVDQAQAIVVALFASLLAIGSRLAQGQPFEPSRALCLMLASTLTATVTSLVLASLMLSMTFAARSLHLNPDNISTPIAAALGDLTSLASLLFFGTLLYPVRQTMAPVLVTVLALLLGSSLLLMWMASREKATRKVLKFGWFPVLAAMCLSSAGGALLEQSINRFPNIGLFQPLINGVGGNLVAVQSSKISTHLFSSGKYGQLPANRLLTYLNPLRTFRCKERESLNALILLALAVPGHLLFLAMIVLANMDSIASWLAPSFVVGYLLAALLQVALLLYICQLLCRLLWLCHLNPDLNSIPLLTALGDLFGSVLLAAAFAFYYSTLT